MGRATNPKLGLAHILVMQDAGRTGMPVRGESECYDAGDVMARSKMRAHLLLPPVDRDRRRKSPVAGERGAS